MMTKGIEADSRKIKSGFTFVAIRGLTHDSHDFISQAVKKGATTVVGEKKLSPKLFPQGVKYVRVKDSKEALGKLASEFYGHPSRKLKIIGVTGTKGKTTTANLIYHLLTKLGQKAGLISSISAKIGGKEVETGLHVTSPDVVSLHRLLKEMVDASCRWVVLEVSSHGIDQKRIAGVHFDAAVLTNIAPEHLDYHGTLSRYKKTKFSFLNSAKIKVVSPEETDLKILPGKFNNLNAETAARTLEAFGFNRRQMIEALHSFKLPQGRMEEVKNKEGFRVFIDFAHTPDSLKAALGYLRTLTKRKLIAVFGCAGERDPAKRAKMGRIATDLADLSVFTAEDPRSENVWDILGEMALKAKKGKFVNIAERGEAIFYALSKAKKGDVVAVLGKGHEKSMAYQGFEHPWSDREVIEAFLSSKDQNVSVVVLAAGVGTRMKSSLPKVIHEICGRPILAYTLENLRRVGIKDVVLVVGFQRLLIKKALGGAVKFAVQKNPKGGTADAAGVGLEKVSLRPNTIVIMNGDDSALYKPETIKEVIYQHGRANAVVTFVSLERKEPKGLGRVVRNSEGKLTGIVEEKDATEVQRKIKEVNDGLYVFDRSWLASHLPKIKESPVTGEYYLVDLVKIALEAKEKIFVYKLKDPSQWQGVNAPEELASAERKMREKLEKYGH